MKHYIKLLSVPLLLLVLSWSLRIVWNIFSLPPAEELAEMARQWFELYGLPVLFASAVVEGMLLVGGYFPGIFMIFLGVILTDSPLEAAIVVSVVTIGLFIAHLINYGLGKYGWYRLLTRFGLKNAIENEREKITKRGTIAIFLSYWLPSAAAITDTAAGIMRMPFRIFLFASLISTIVWNVIAGTLVYLFKDSALSVAGGPGSSGGNIFYMIIGFWIVVLLVIDFYGKRKHLNISKDISSIP